MKTPAGIRLSRDLEGVLHVDAKDVKDLYWGMGYAHALDRGLQMLMTRTLGQGRACELLNDDEDMLGVDLFFRRMNWSGRVEAEVAQIDQETLDLVNAYCDGVNQRFGEKIPWELRAVGHRVDPWTVEDVILMTRMIGYINLAQSQGDLERFFIEVVQAGVDDARVEALFPGALQAVDRASVEAVTLGARVVANSALWGLVPRMIASNSWVIHGSRTASGKPIMANDPHLEVNRLPNVWCEQVLSTPDNRAICATMPGIPGPLIGRHDHVAWGATYTFMDAVDSWMEDCKEGTFRRGDAWQPFVERRETILRKKGEPHEVVFYDNLHGTLDGDPHVPGIYLATRWSASDSGSASIMAAKDMWHATTVQEGMAALGRLETAWNWVFADVSGQIGYQMSGRMPRRHPDWDGFVPAPGWDEAYDWQGFVDLKELPRCVDPPEGFIVTANQDLNHLGHADPINAPMGDWRARRIEEQLARTTEADVALCQALQTDVHSLHAEEFMELFRPGLEKLQGDREIGASAAAMMAWNFSYDAPEAATFEAIYTRLCAEVLGVGLGPEVWDFLVTETGLFTDFYDTFDAVILDLDSPWWQDLDPGHVLDVALRHGLAYPVTPWPQTIRMGHMLLGGRLPAWLGFDVKSLVLRGGRSTPNQGQIYRSGGRVTCFAPSIRMVADLGQAHVHTSLAGGPSDRRFSRWYTRDLARWQAGTYKKVGAVPPGKKE